MNIFVLVRLDILSPSESDHFPLFSREAAGFASKCMLWKVDKLIVPDGKCLLHLTRYFRHSYLYHFSWKISSHFEVVIASVKNRVNELIWFAWATRKTILQFAGEVPHSIVTVNILNSESEFLHMFATGFCGKYRKTCFVWTLKAGMMERRNSGMAESRNGGKCPKS